MSVHQDTSDVGLEPAGAPRVVVREPYGGYFEAELLAEGERCEIRRLDTGDRETVRSSQLIRNGFEVTRKR